MNHHETKICLNLAASEMRHEVLNGRRYLVCPAVMLCTGVWSGSRGPLLYTAEALEKFAAAWNGRSICYRHPAYGDQPVSIGEDPDLFSRATLGFIFDAHFHGGKLRANLWIDIEKTEQDAPEVLEWLRSGRNLELSTGLFSDGQDTPGTWKGKRYDRIVKSIFPDHVAILPPGERAACPWEAGAGIRANCGWETGCQIQANTENCKKNTNSEETQIMEEAMEAQKFFWDCPIDVQRRVRAHFAANHTPEIAENKCHRLTAEEAVELDKQIRGSKCGGCGPTDNADGEEPLLSPEMKW